jgi:2-oxoglutarate ferredoxin oxidoreductase subunit gamma
MYWDVVIAGFGGQGLLFGGRVLAHAALLDGLEVAWLPSYGPQMRGGTANCTVILSDQPIHSPVVRHPLGLIALNGPSLDEFEARLKAGAVIVVNSSLVGRPTSRADARSIEVPASGIAKRMGTVRVANLVALGAYVGATRCVSTTSIEAALAKLIPESRADVRALNAAAFREGVTYGEAALG